MAKGVFLTPEVIINGSFGELIDHEGNFLGNVQEVSFKVVNKRRSFTPLGFRRETYKHTGTSGEGTISQYKVNSSFLTNISKPMWDPSEVQPIVFLLVNLDDPESIGYEEVVLTNVKFWEINGGWRVNEMVMENIPFTFQSMFIPTPIDSDPAGMFRDLLHSRYNTQRNI